MSDSERVPLHEAMRMVLLQSDGPMSSREMADEIEARALYLRGDGRPAGASQIGARARRYPHLFVLDAGLIGLR